jgi:uncharacterized protein
MKVIVVSDSHGSTETLTEIAERYQNEVDVMFHCGDSELSKEHPAISPFITVRGNCDFETSFPNELIHSINGCKFLVTHGHLYQIKTTLMKLYYQAEEQGAHIVLFGHSHQLGVEKIGNHIFLNPGSIFLPRGRKERTYALIEGDQNTLTIRFFTDDHEELGELKRKFSLT